MKTERIKLSRPGHSYWIEGFVVAMSLLGLALILAPDRLHDLLAAWVSWGKIALSQFWAAFNHFMDQLTTAKLAGFVLLGAVAAMLAWRQWSRLVDSERLSATTCPSCGGDLRRIHRNWLDRLAGRLSGIPLRRYRCNDESCGWQGLLRRREHQHLEGG
jgi:hypothetical protein